MPKNIPKIPWLYLLLSFAFSWAIWIPVSLTGKNYQGSPFLLSAVLVGAFGPGLAAIIHVYSTRDPEQISDFRQRVFDFHRIRPGWYIIILALWPALHGTAIVITRLLSGSIPESPFLQEILRQPSTIPLVIFLYFIQAGVEELGWRGYLQEKLGILFGPSRSSLLVGVIHTFWHLPLFWVVGTNQMKMGFGPDFLIFVAFVVSSAVLTAWCYYGNKNSIMAATLLHTTGNLSFDIFAYAPGTLKHLIYVLLMVAGAVSVLLYFQTRAKQIPH
jgi:membrane protease YdiL (CAAX protease family)